MTRVSSIKGTIAVTLALVGTLGCSSQSPKNRFLLAEKLWQEGKYAAAVTEYEQVMRKEEGSDLGLQAAYRAAMTESLFLNHHADAIRKLNRIEDLKKDGPLTHEAQRQIGEILFTKLEQYEPALAQYGKLIDRYPKDPHYDEYLYRMGKSQYFLTKFDDSIQTFALLRKKFPQSIWSERALFEMGVAAQTQGNQRQSRGGAANESFKQAIGYFQDLVKFYPKSDLVTQARFGIASSLEELDQLDSARQIYEELKSTYPTPLIVELKLKRIKDRKAQKNL